MHEFAVTEGLLEIVQTEARKVGARRVEQVHIAIGELSTFVDRSIEFYFSELSRGTSAEGAELVFNRIEARAYCDMCQLEFRPESAFFTCPECDGAVLIISQGKELYVDSIEVG